MMRTMAKALYSVATRTVLLKQCRGRVASRSCDAEAEQAESRGNQQEQGSSQGRSTSTGTAILRGRRHGVTATRAGMSVTPISASVR